MKLLLLEMTDRRPLDTRPRPHAVPCAPSALGMFGNTGTGEPRIVGWLSGGVFPERLACAGSRMPILANENFPICVPRNSQLSAKGGAHSGPQVAQVGRKRVMLHAQRRANQDDDVDQRRPPPAARSRLAAWRPWLPLRRPTSSIMYSWYELHIVQLQPNFATTGRLRSSADAHSTRRLLHLYAQRLLRDERWLQLR